MRDENRREQIRKRSRDGVEAAAALREAFTDPHLKEMAKYAGWHYDDPRRFFADEDRADRSPSEEANWLAHADHALDMADAELKTLKSIRDKFGPTAQVKLI